MQSNNPDGRDVFDVLVSNLARISDDVRDDIDKRLHGGSAITSTRDGVTLVEQQDATGQIITTVIGTAESARHDAARRGRRTKIASAA
jgi:hypothetical protein